MFSEWLKSRKVSRGYIFLGSALLVAVFISSPVHAVNWDGVEGRTVTLFYPGQASWEWALTQSDHSGNERFRQGRNCAHCHEGEQSEIGAVIVSGDKPKLEPRPIAGKTGSVPLDVKVVNDGSRLHVRMEWKDTGYKPNEPMDKDNALRVTMMLDNGGVREAGRASCWGSCHDDASNMASAGDSDRTKYLAASRKGMSRSGGGDNVKDSAELAKLLAANGFMEYWQARLTTDGNSKGVHGYIMDKRHEELDSQVDAVITRNGDTLVAVISRDLATSGNGYKSLSNSDKLMVGFALHDGHAKGRYHHVSLEYTLSLDGSDADLKASKR